MKRYSVSTLFMLFIICSQAHTQDSVVLSPPVIQQAMQTRTATDTVPSTNLSEAELKNIVDMRSQFEKQNGTYTAPARPSEGLLRFLKKDELEMSDEALYWASLVRDASNAFDANMSFRDTMIVNPLFMPILFRGEYLPENLTFYNADPLKSSVQLKPLYQPDSIFGDVARQKKMESLAYRFVQDNYPTLFRYSMNNLPKEVIKAKAIKKNITEDLPLKVESDPSFGDVSAPVKFIPERRYWHSGFESAIQFSEGYVSPNWPGGGSEFVNLTLFTKNNLIYNYIKDKIQFTNELELKVSLNNAPKDTLHDYKVSNDVLRLHSNFGYRAFSKWYYTFDAEFKTQMFSSFKENSEVKQAAFFAPVTATFGLGMKYDLDKKFKSKYKSLKLSVNIAPLSYSYSYSAQSGVDLGSYSFKLKEGSTTEYENTLSRLGSSISGNMAVNFSRNISWQSRVNYFTTYEQVVGEFENTLILAISRYFSTRIYLYVRYDDGVEKKEPNNSYFQYNQLLSFGFNYKW